MLPDSDSLLKPDWRKYLCVHQELPKYLRGYHNCSKEDVIEIASLLFRIKNQSDKSQSIAMIPRMLKELVPMDQLKIMSDNDWKKVQPVIVSPVRSQPVLPVKRYQTGGLQPFHSVLFLLPQLVLKHCAAISTYLQEKWRKTFQKLSSCAVLNWVFARTKSFCFTQLLFWIYRCSFFGRQMTDLLQLI